MSQLPLPPDPRFVPDLLDWFSHRARKLPWRGEGRSLYRTWVSEIMLQQTRVDTVIPYFERWMVSFPSVHHLADAPLDQVLKAWAGLGYYSRARNLHAAAQIVRDSGSFPTTFEGWKSLPGVGDYVAGAVTSLAMGLDEPAVDGNLERVLSRLFRLPGGRKEITNLARKVLPSGRAGDFNEALMDLGSSVCTARNPTCKVCPILDHCGASESPLLWPTPKPKREVPHRLLIALVLRESDRVLVVRRPENGLFGGLFDLPSVFLEDPPEQAHSFAHSALPELADLLNIQLLSWSFRGEVLHTLTHMKVHMHLFEGHFLGDPTISDRAEFGPLAWIPIHDEVPIGISKLVQKAIEMLRKPRQISLDFR